MFPRFVLAYYYPQDDYYQQHSPTTWRRKLLSEAEPFPEPEASEDDLDKEVEMILGGQPTQNIMKSEVAEYSFKKPTPEMTPNSSDLLESLVNKHLLALEAQIDAMKQRKPLPLTFKEGERLMTEEECRYYDMWRGRTHPQEMCFNKKYQSKSEPKKRSRKDGANINPMESVKRAKHLEVCT